MTKRWRRESACLIGNYSVSANDTIPCVVANRSSTRHPPTRSARHQLQTRRPKMPPWWRHDEDMTKRWRRDDEERMHFSWGITVFSNTIQFNARSPSGLDATSTDAIWTTPRFLKNSLSVWSSFMRVQLLVGVSAGTILNDCKTRQLWGSVYLFWSSMTKVRRGYDSCQARLQRFLWQ